MCRAEFQHPAPHRFIGDVDPTLGQQFLDVAVAQGEAEIQPDRVLDDLRREAMAVVVHVDILSLLLAPDAVSVTMPSSPTLSEALHDRGKLKHVLDNFRYRQLFKLGRRGRISDTDLVEQFAYQLRFYREINVLGDQARRARYW